MSDKNRKIAIIIAAILGCVGLFYLGGMLGQLLGNYAVWMDSGGVSGESTMKPVSWNPLICFPAAFSGNGIKGILMILLIAGAIFAYVKLHDKFDGKQHDPRGFARSKSGIYGTASWMDEKEMKEVLEISPVPDAKGTILGEYKGKAVCMPEDTRLNRHIAVFGASGTMKSRAIIRNALFQALRRSESVIVTDSKGELYADTSEMFRNAGYDVKIYSSMIDLSLDYHAHILPGCDHGSSSVDMSLKQMDMAKEAGIQTICATPHFYPHKESVSSFIERRRQTADNLWTQIPADSPRVLLGAEVLICDGMERLNGLRELCLEGTNELLLEMPFYRWPAPIWDTLYRLNDLRDIQIVIAHADRYPPEDIHQLISEGIPLQLNAECLRKHLHRKRYLEWIQKGYVSYLGSDIHEFGPGYHDFEKCRKLLCRYL